MSMQSRTQSRAFLEYGLQTSAPRRPPLNRQKNVRVHPLQIGRAGRPAHEASWTPIQNPEFSAPLESSEEGSGAPPTENGRGHHVHKILVPNSKPKILSPLNRQKYVWVHPPADSRPQTPVCIKRRVCSWNRTYATLSRLICASQAINSCLTAGRSHKESVS